jgi:hypothetical protein
MTPGGVAGISYEHLDGALGEVGLGHQSLGRGSLVIAEAISDRWQSAAVSVPDFGKSKLAS